MQIKADFTKEELLGSNDILANACYPIGKIRVIGSLLWGLDGDELETGNVLNTENIQMMSDMLKDACNEIDYLIEIANEQWRCDRAKGGSND